MKKITMRTLMSGPKGSREIGKSYPVDNDEAKQLVDGGYAVYTMDEKRKEKEKAALKQDETATVESDQTGTVGPEETAGGDGDVEKTTQAATSTEAIPKKDKPKRKKRTPKKKKK